MGGRTNAEIAADRYKGKSKTMWIDTETTGLDPKRNAIIQIAGLIEIDGKITDKFNYSVRPFPGAVIDPEALKVNKKKESEIKTFPSIKSVHEVFTDGMSKYVNRYDKTDKFIIAGYNVGFDDEFLRSFFKQAGDDYYGSWFYNVRLDVMAIVAEEIRAGALRLPNYKLTTVCDAYGLSKYLKNAHTADADIYSTYLLYTQILKKRFGRYIDAYHRAMALEHPENQNNQANPINPTNQTNKGQEIWVCEY